MKFSYAGVTRHKEQVRGTIEAEDEIEAKMKLRSMQIRPTKLSESKGVAFDFSLDSLNSITIGPVIDLKGIMIFTRQFSSLIDSGVPVVQCLEILGAQEKRPLFKRVLVQIKSDVEAGSGLAEALAKHPKAFSEFFIRIVEAGELSGTLDVAFRRVGIQLEKLGAIRRKVSKALMYPTITVVTAIGVLIFLLVKVIPEVSKLYAEAQASLPDITLTVLALSKWFQEQYYVLLGGIAAVVGGTVVIYRMEAFREFWDPLVIRLPLFGNLVKKSNVARFTRTLATLIASGVPLLNAFDICVKLVENRALKQVIRDTASAVTEGKNIAQGLAAGGIFPPMVVHMVNIGEMTGRLDELLGKVSDILDDEVDDAVEKMTSLLQPVLIIIVGIIIMFLLVSMYLPIFQLAEKVTGGV